MILKSREQLWKKKKKAENQSNATNDLEDIDEDARIKKDKIAGAENQSLPDDQNLSTPDDQKDKILDAENQSLPTTENQSIPDDQKIKKIDAENQSLPDDQNLSTPDDQKDKSQNLEDENELVPENEDQDQEKEKSEEFSEWSADKDTHGNRFGGYDEDRQEILRSLLLRIKNVFEENKLKIELIPDDIIIIVNDDNYLEFRLPGKKYYVMHLTLEYKPNTNKHYAVMDSDDFVDRSRSVLYISEKRLEDQIQHLAGHLESFILFFYSHVNNRREFEELEDKLEAFMRIRFEHAFGQFKKVIDTKNYKMIEVSVDGEKLKDGRPMINKFDICIYKLDSKHFMIDMKGEIREMSMIVKIFLDDTEFELMMNKIVKTAYENNQQEFSWKAVPDMMIAALDVLKGQENTGPQGGTYLEIERTGDEAEFGPENNTIQYLVKHIPGDNEDSDEEILIDINCYLFKDEFLPSIYFNINSKVYQSEYLVPFISPSAEFSIMMLESITKAYNTIKKIIYDLADIDEQDVYTYNQDQIIGIIKEGISEFELCDKDDIKTVEVLDTEYDGIPYKEEKIFHNPKMYFTVHNIEMEEERTGFLVNCYNLISTKGDVGEYRIYETNYYDCKDDFENFVRTCVVS